MIVDKLLPNKKHGYFYMGFEFEQIFQKSVILFCPFGTESTELFSVLCLQQKIVLKGKHRTTISWKIALITLFGALHAALNFGVEVFCHPASSV